MTKKSADQKTVLIIDEFPFMAGPNPSIKSILQHEIDHHWKNQNIFLILCGSSVSFMINDIMGYESPLYGRATFSMEVLPFDYLDSAKFFPDYSLEDKLIAYGILGGIPCYLSAFSGERSLQENIEREILRNGALLNDEPMMLLKMELREPNVYNSILDDISDFMGLAFEDICRQYLIRKAKLKKLPFVPFHIGKWWGNNPAIRAQDDVDLLALK